MESLTAKRHKCFTVDLDPLGNGIKGFRRFKALKDAIRFHKKKGGVLFHEYQDGELHAIPGFKQSIP